MTSAGPDTSTRVDRIHGLDAARAGAVAFMIFGHTADALLSMAVRDTPALQSYWILRGITAPLFLFVSGWAVMTAISRSGAVGSAVLRARVPRVLLLFGLGLLLRWPGWGVDRLFALEPYVVAHFIGFDALQCIGLALLLCAAALSVVHTPQTRLLMMGALAVLVPAVGMLPQAVSFLGGLPQPVPAAFVMSGTSPFPLLPWGGYFFAGTCAALLLPLIRRPAFRGLALGVAGLVLMGAVQLWFSRSLPITHPVMYLHRLGEVLAVCAVWCALPAAVATRLQPVGRSTLVLYVFHIPIVYGWSAFPSLHSAWGRTLSLWQVFAVAAVLLVGGLLLARAIRSGRAALERLFARRTVAAS